MKRQQKISMILVVFLAVWIPMVYPQPIDTDVPYYHVQALIRAGNPNATWIDNIRIDLRTPARPAGMFRSWSYESLEGGLNETLNGTKTFRFTWEAQVRFVYHNESYWTRWYDIENAGDYVLVFSFSGINYSYILEAWATIHHWESELVYLPMTFNMEANIKNE